MTDFGNLLGSKGPKIATTLAALSAPVGSSPLVVTAFDVSGGKGLELLGQPVHVTGSSELSAAFSASGATESSVFQVGDAWTQPANRCLAALDLQGAIGVAAKGSSVLLKPVALSASLNAAAKLRYRHLLSVPKTIARASALADLVGRSQIPQLVSLADLADGEVHQLTALFSVALGAEATLGKEIAFKKDLFSGLAPEIEIHFQYAVKASLNASLYESLQWTVGKGAAFTVNPGWVRLRAEREHRHRLTLGVQLALDVQYNFGSVLEALLNRVLELNPVARAMAALRDLRAQSALVAAGDWNAIQAAIGQAAADQLMELLGPILADAPALQAVVDLSDRVVRAYDELGETLQSFWDGLLNRGDLGEQRKAVRILLTRIQKLPDDPTTLLSPGEQDLIPLIETLSGLSLEEIWLGSGATSLLVKVKEEATRALGFLDTVEKLPDRVLSLITGFAERTGIAGTLAWLRTNATSLDKLNAAAKSRVQELIAKLLGKAFRQIDASDLQKLQAWAQRLDAILAAPEEYEKELRAKLKLLDGALSFKLAMEIDRVSRSTALLDLEIDPTDKSTVKAVQRLAAGSVASVLNALPAGEDGKTTSSPATLPYLLRECAFSSQRLRTSTRSFFFSLLGTTSNTRQRLTESAIDVRQVGATITRHASYSGVFTRSTKVETTKKGLELTTRFAASAGWIARARGDGANLDAPYSTPDHRLRLTLTRDDDATTAEEIAAIGRLLADLGFALAPAPDAQAADHATRLAVSIELPAVAVAGFLGDGTFDEPWNLDYLNAARRWFDEPLAPPEELAHGTVLAALMADPVFEAAWTRTPAKFEKDFENKTIQVQVAKDLTVPVVLVRPGGGDHVTWGTFNVVRDLIFRRRDSQSPLSKAGQAFDPAPSDHASMSRFAARFAHAVDALSPGFWNSPAFAVWFVLSRVARTSLGSLAQARGLASLRFKDEVSGEWSPPQRWKLDPARLPRRAQGKGIFPIGAHWASQGGTE